MSEWLLINSAPKDGTPILAWAETDGLFIGQHLDFWVDDYGNECGPTHWMPLPKPPKESE